MDEVSIEEARRTLGDIIDRARLTGKPTRITRHGKPAAVLVPVEWYERRREDEQAFRSMGQTLRDLEGGKQ